MTRDAARSGVPLSTVQAVLLDLEGTLYQNGRSLPGAVAALTRLRQQRHGIRFLTNIDSRAPAPIAGQLSGLGLPIPEADLFTPLSAAQALVEQTPGARVHTLISPELRSTLPGLVDQPPYSHVLVGDCRDILDYSRLDAAFRAVRAGAELLALQRGRYFKRDDGDHLDTGAIVAALEYASGVTARVLGKPARDFFGLAAASLGIPLERCLVVGDDATSDIAGGVAAGALTVQVRTGKYSDQAAEGLVGRAHLTIDSIADLPALLEVA